MKLKDICSLEKSYDQPGHHIKKQRHQFADRGPYTQSYDLSSRFFTYGCESWTIKKAECRRIDAFELWCWRRLLRVPWTARRSKQPILKEISPECSLEGLVLKLKLQNFGHLMRRTDSLERPWCWERLKVGGEGDDRGWDGWMASLTQWTWVWINSGSWFWTAGTACCSPWGHKESDTTEWLNWTANSLHCIAETNNIVTQLLLSRFSRVRLFATPWNAAH